MIQKRSTAMERSVFFITGGPNVLFMGYRQIVQTQIRHRITRCLTRIFTTYLQYVLLKFKRKRKISSNIPKIGNELVLLIMVGKSIRRKWVKLTCAAKVLLSAYVLASSYCMCERRRFWRDCVETQACPSVQSCVTNIWNRFDRF